MIGALVTGLGLILINQAESDKQVAIGGVIAGLGANMVLKSMPTEK